MLIAAMILGLIGGISYFIGGITGLTGVEGSTPWWNVAMIPVGLVGIIGGALPRHKPALAGGLLLLAGVSALAVGLSSANVLIGPSSDSSLFGLAFLSMHPLVGSAFYLPPLFALVIAGALALAANKTPVTKSAAQGITFLG